MDFFITEMGLNYSFIGCEKIMQNVPKFKSILSNSRMILELLGNALAMIKHDWNWKPSKDKGSNSGRGFKVWAGKIRVLKLPL